MATLWRALCLLPLLFSVGQAGFLFLPDLEDLFGSKPTNADTPTEYLGEWELVTEDSGVSGMHVQLFPNNKAIMFDAGSLGPSKLKLNPEQKCRHVPRWGKRKEYDDCWAHAIEYDIDTGEIRPLKMVTDGWCSSGGLSPNGTLINVGGWEEGGKALRFLDPCDTCDWRDYAVGTSVERWYATQAQLPDGSFIVVGGRHMFSYEFVPLEGQSNNKNFYLPLLQQTNDKSENNLYPFVHLSTDGNLFILANNRAILFDYKNNKAIHEFPVLEGGARNYPGSGMAAFLPIKLAGAKNPKKIPAEILVCGGAKPEAFRSAAKRHIYLPALDSCGRITITDLKAQWIMETMPTPRVMGDMLNLPTGDLLIINGGTKGSSGWQFADDPNFVPLLYSPDKPINNRFKELAPTTIARMYHSSSAVLPDGKILVAGSNTNPGYMFQNVKFPTELRIEKFSPPYLEPAQQGNKVEVMPDASDKAITYASTFNVQFRYVDPLMNKDDITVTMYAPPFTTHGYSMNQRLLVLETTDMLQLLPGLYKLTIATPPSNVIAPPGYYLVFLVYKGVPSQGIWVQIL